MLHGALGRGLGHAVQGVLLGGDERVGRDLHEPGGRERVQHPASPGLLRGPPASGGGGGQAGGDLLVADDAGDLLGEVLLGRQVRAPGGHGDLPDVAPAVHGAADALEHLEDLLLGVVHPDPRRRVAHRQGDLAGLEVGADVGDPVLGPGAGQLLQQLHGALGGRGGHLRVHPALEALGGLRGQPVPASGAGDRDLLEVRRLDQHVPGLPGDLGLGSAHDPGQADGLVGVGDHQVLRVQLAVLPVEGLQGLPGAGPADVEGSGDLLGVVEVQGLAQLQHDVVGDVHGQGDRADPSQAQAGGQPRRGRPGGVQVPHGAGDEAGAARAVVDGGVVAQVHDVALPVVRGRPLGQGLGRVGEGGVHGQAVLPGHPAHGERVAAVRGHVDLRGLVGQPQQLQGVLAGFGVQAELAEDDDPLVLIGQAQLAGGGDHPGGDVTVGLARGDPEVPGQHGPGQGHDDLVPHGEVVGPAHDALDPGGLDALPLQGLLAALGDHAHLAPVDGLAVGVGLRLHGQHLPDDDGPGDVVQGPVHGLLLEADPHQRLQDVLGGGALRQGGVLAQPGQRNSHGSRSPSRRLN